MPEPRIEGDYVVAVIDSVTDVSPVFESRARDILADAGIDDPEPSAAYDAAAFGDAMTEMADTTGQTTVKRAGEQMVAQNGAITAQESFVDGFEVLCEQHEAVHRSFSTEAVGDYRAEQTGDREHRVATYGGYAFPEALARGVTEGVVKATESPTIVAFDDATPEPDETHAFVVSW